MTLTHDQVRAFQDVGYLIVPDVFDPADLEPIRQELADRIDEKLKALHAAGTVRELHEDEDFDHRLVKVFADNPEAGQQVLGYLQGRAGGGQVGPAVFGLLTHPKLLAAVACLVGPEVVGSSIYRLRPKLPRFGGGVVPWHQDSGYFAAQCDSHLVLTCWIPLVDADVRNGCMQILPRAHRQGIAPHRTGGNAGFLVIEDRDLPGDGQAAPIPAPCPRGGVVFMTNMTPHCSTPNDADHVRWSVDLRYQGAGVPHNVDLLPIDGLARQSDDFTVACYPPEADFVVQSLAHPERVTSYETFVRRRTAYDAAARQGSLRYPDRGWKPVGAAVV